VAKVTLPLNGKRRGVLEVFFCVAYEFSSFQLVIPLHCVTFSDHCLTYMVVLSRFLGHVLLVKKHEFRAEEQASVEKDEYLL